VSRLSRDYDLINPSQPNTPSTTSPVFPNVVLPPNPIPSSPENGPPSYETDDDSKPNQKPDNRQETESEETESEKESDAEDNSDDEQTQQPETEEMATEQIAPFHGDKEDESPEDFIRAYYRRMGDKSDDFKKAQFPYYLQADSVADEWFEDLDDEDKKSWALIENAFVARWPRKTQVKKTDDEYEDEIVGRKLKTEDLGKKEKVAGREVYTHVAWADKMAQLVKGAKWEKTTNQLRRVRKELPTVLREKIGTGHVDWNDFLKAVRTVDVEHIRDSIDIKNKDQADIDKRFKALEALSRSPTAPLRQQLSTVSISQPTTNPPVVGDPFLGTGGGRGNLAFVQNSAIPRQPKPPFSNTNPRPAHPRTKS
jgi:hypothetical protein